MEATQCDAPQRSTLATCIGVQADACGHGKLGGLLSGKLGDNRFLVRIVPRSVGRHLIPPSSSLATMSPTNSSTSIILHDIDSIWPGVAPQLAAAPVVAPIPPAIVTPPFVERTLELGEHPPMVYAGPFVPTGTAPPHLVEHRDNILSDKSLIMIEEAAAARDVPPMPSVPRNPDEWFEAENWWTSAGYFARTDHFGTW